MNEQHLIIIVIETKTTTEYAHTEFFTGGGGGVGRKSFVWNFKNISNRKQKKYRKCTHRFFQGGGGRCWALILCVCIYIYIYTYIIMLNSVRQHNCFITQSNYTGYMFRLLISHLQAYFNRLVTRC